MTRIAIPLSGGQFSSHFGGADAFAFIDADPTSGSILKSEALEAPPHEQGAFPNWIRSQGATVVLAGGMGPRAVQMLEGSGVRVVTGVAGGDPLVIAGAYLAGTLDTSGETCSGGHLHGCGDHGHG